MKTFRGVLVCLCLAAAACENGAGQDATALLPSHVQQILDEKQIHDLIVQYGRSLDSKDFSGYSELFAKEGELERPVERRHDDQGP